VCVCLCVLKCVLRCVVRYEAIVPGNQELVVLYRGQLYNMATEEKLEQFMRSVTHLCHRYNTLC